MQRTVVPVTWALQDKIYYLVTPKRSFAESSPYFEAFKKKDLEVLFLYNPIDDFLMGQLGEFKGRLVCVPSLKG